MAPCRLVVYAETEIVLENDTCTDWSTNASRDARVHIRQRNNVNGMHERCGTVAGEK